MHVLKSDRAFSEIIRERAGGNEIGIRIRYSQRQEEEQPEEESLFSAKEVAQFRFATCVGHAGMCWRLQYGEKVGGTCGRGLRAPWIVRPQATVVSHSLQFDNHLSSL